MKNNIFSLIIGYIQDIAEMLDSFEFWEVSLLMWLAGFIVVGMFVSVFWRGARG